jgi:hypothetical protein
MNHRQLSSRPDTPAYEAPGLLGAVTQGFWETRSLLGRRAANAQTVINYPSGSTGATGHITLDNPLVGGAIHSNQDQGGRTL